MGKAGEKRDPWPLVAQVLTYLSPPLASALSHLHKLIRTPPVLLLCGLGSPWLWS